MKLKIELDLDEDVDAASVLRILTRAAEQVGERAAEWQDGCWDDLRDPEAIDGVRGSWAIEQDSTTVKKPPATGPLLTPAELRVRASKRRKLANDLDVPGGCSPRASLAAKCYREQADQDEAEADRLEIELGAA